MRKSYWNLLCHAARRPLLEVSGTHIRDAITRHERPVFWYLSFKESVQLFNYPPHHLLRNRYITTTPTRTSKSYIIRSVSNPMHLYEICTHLPSTCANPVVAEKKTRHSRSVKIAKKHTARPSISTLFQKIPRHTKTSTGEFHSPKRAKPHHQSHHVNNSMCLLIGTLAPKPYRNSVL